MIHYCEHAPRFLVPKHSETKSSNLVKLTFTIIVYVHARTHTHTHTHLYISIVLLNYIHLHKTNPQVLKP